MTTEYVERTFERIKGRVEPYWVCLPMATRTALSSYEMYWYPWDDTRRDAWVREMPQKEYVVNLENNPISTYRYRMHQEDLAKQFGRWYRISHGGRKTVCLLGIRADESLQRYSGFLNKKFGYKGECWISKQRYMARQLPVRLRLQPLVRPVLHGRPQALADARGLAVQ